MRPKLGYFSLMKYFGFIEVNRTVVGPLTVIMVLEEMAHLNQRKAYLKQKMEIDRKKLENRLVIGKTWIR